MSLGPKNLNLWLARVCWTMASVLIVSDACARQLSYDGGFERAVNRYRWNARLVSALDFGTWRIAAADRYQSDAFLLFDDRLSFRDVNQFSLLAERPVSQRVRAVGRGRSDWFSLSRVVTQSLYGGITWSLPGAEVTPLLGVAMDRRPGVRRPDGETPMRLDAGPAVGAEVRIPRRDVGGYAIALEGSGFREEINPRRGQAARLEGSAERTFERTLLRLDLQGGMARRDAYQAASFLNRDDLADRRQETVESTRSDTLAATLGVQSPIGSALVLSGSVLFNANNRSVRTLRAPEEALFFDSDFRRRTVDAQAGLVFDRSGTQLRGSFQSGAEIERRILANEADLPRTQAVQKRDLLSQADYDRGYLTLQTGGRLPLTPKTVLAFDISANAIRHDTPLINPDDRDEIFYNGRAALLYRPSRALEADVQVFGSHYHTVYLKSERSAENNVQQGLRLRPGVRWRPGRDTRISLTSEVRATYTIDDFVLPGRRPTDQAARELRHDLELDHALWPGLRVQGELSLSDLRLGRFLQDQFAEIPIDTLRTYGAWLRVQSGTRVTAEVGLRLFIRTDFDRAATVRYPRTDDDGTVLVDGEGAPLTTTISRPGRKRIAQIGPTCALNWPLRAGFLRFEGWYTVQRVSRRLYGDLPDGRADLIQSVAERGERTIIPNLALSMRWAL